jgi:hypothetical protein
MAVDRRPLLIPVSPIPESSRVSTLYVKISAVEIWKIRCMKTQRKSVRINQNQLKRNKAVSNMLKGPLKVLKSMRISAALKF